MENANNKIAVLGEVKDIIATQYQKQISNYFGDKKQSLKFLSGIVDSIQRTPELQSCDAVSLVNSFMIMAQLGFMPSVISGEAYVLPYKNKAQFQLGYQGIITLLYRAGAKSVVTEIVRKNDRFSIKNGELSHEIDPFISKEKRGAEIGAYAIIVNQTGGKVEKFMRAEEIISFGQKFSKSFNSSFSAWKTENDPEKWMWKKTVLKQAAKLAPKNETINLAMHYDNKDSIISDRIEKEAEAIEGLKMRSLEVEKPKVAEKPNNKKNDKDQNKKKEESSKDQTETGQKTLT